MISPTGRGRLLAASIAVTVVLASFAGANDLDTEGWDASVTVGYTLNSGNTENSLLNVSVVGEHKAGDNITRLGVEGSYGETEIEEAPAVEGQDPTARDETTTQNAKAFANYKRTFGRAFGYLDASVLHDDIADVDYRAVIGPGAGYFVVSTDIVKLSFETGPSYIMEKVGGVSDDYLAIRFAERVEWKISDTAKTWQQVEYLPRADDFDDYLLTAEVGLEAAVNSSLSLSLVAKDKYDNTPAPGLDENDVTVIAGLIYKLW
jgi:putative salt-induced outer membrane protein YdiY